VVNPQLIEAARNGNSLTVDLPPPESLIELSYGAQVTPWFLIRPDAQYILNRAHSA